MNTATQSADSQRRGTRIRAQLPLRVTSLDPAFEFSEPAHTLVVNTQGCGVRLSHAMQPGIAVRLHDLPAGKSVTARVANCVPLGNEGKYWLVGIALDEPGNVWGIAPAPADWVEEHQAQSPAAAAAVPVKRNEWPYAQFSSKGEFHPGRK